MNRDLFLAILSMDSYNRGYGRGIKFTVGESTAPRNESGVQIGTAVVRAQSNVLDGSDAVNAGFYAIAYDMTGVAGFVSGERVIAYRGTDGILAGDLLYGWTLGGGGVDFQPAMLTANHRAVAANDNQPDAGLERAFRSGSNDDRQCRKFLLTPWT
jgi:hypothetical protein